MIYGDPKNWILQESRAYFLHISQLCNRYNFQLPM